MRHRKKFNHLGRTSSHRKAMLSNMASSLILHKRIKTTLAKAKALRMYVEPLINKSKEDTTHSRRVVFSNLQNKEAVSELFREVSVKVADRPGGYTRILKLGNRLGDAAEVCYIELVDYNENMLADKAAAGDRKRTRRTRRKKTAGAPEAVAAEAAVEVKEEAAEGNAETKAEEVVDNAAPAAEKKEEKPSEDKTEE